MSHLPLSPPYIHAVGVLLMAVLSKHLGRRQTSLHPAFQSCPFGKSIRLESRA